MPVPSKMSDLFTIASSNSPAGSDAIGNSLDDYLRAVQAIIRSTNALASASLAASSTTDLGSADAESVQVTGSASISSFGTTAPGIVRECRFSGVCTIVNSSAIVIPGASNIVTKAGDVIRFRSIGSGNWIYVCGTQQPGYLPSTGGSLTGQLILAPSAALGNTAGNNYVPLIFQQNTSNNDQLVLQHNRVSSGSDWATANIGIYRKVDASPQGFIQFGEVVSGTGLAFGSGSTTYASMTGAGAWSFASRPTFNGNLAWDAGNFNPGNYLPLGGGTLTGTLTIQRNTADYNFISLKNTGGAEIQIDANGNTEGNIRTVTNHPLTFMTNNALRLTIAAAGNATFTGIVSAVDFTATSDMRLKSDIKRLGRGLKELQKMLPREYTMDGQRRVGFLAQEARSVIPEAVQEDENGVLSLSHSQTLALVANAVLDLAEIIEGK